MFNISRYYLAACLIVTLWATQAPAQSGTDPGMSPTDSKGWSQPSADFSDDQFEEAYDWYYGQAGKSVDYSKAFALFQKGAYAGHGESMNYLGICYNRGEGVDKNDKLASDWFLKAAKNESPGGQYNLGVMYAQGHGVSKDLRKALRLFHMAADQGYLQAQHNLGLMYKDGLGVFQDYRLAFAWFHRAADHGLVPSQYWLGRMYDLGHGVPKNHQMAVEWYRIAAGNGSRDAKRTLRQRGVR